MSSIVALDATRGGSVPKEFFPAVRKGVEGALERGLVAGYCSLTSK